MARLSKILFAILIGFSFVAGSGAASPSSYRHRRQERRHDRGYKHEGKRIGRGVGRAGKGVGRGTGRAGRKTGRKIKHIVT